MKGLRQVSTPTAQQKYNASHVCDFKPLNSHTVLKKQKETGETNSNTVFYLTQDTQSGLIHHAITIKSINEMLYPIFHT